jgi:redox-sensitive bicupin YhaK (pirin superfamily)
MNAISRLGPSEAILFGGVPFEEKILMWWNFVARTQNEITDAWLHWAAGDERFGVVATRVQRIAVGPPPWVLHNS